MFLASGDFNLDPAVVAQWVAATGARLRVAAPPQRTCYTAEAASTPDFMLVIPHLLQAMAWPAVRENSGIKTHLPVRSGLFAEAEDVVQKAYMLKRSHPVPVIGPHLLPQYSNGQSSGATSLTS